MERVTRPVSRSKSARSLCCIKALKEASIWVRKTLRYTLAFLPLLLPASIPDPGKQSRKQKMFLRVFPRLNNLLFKLHTGRSATSIPRLIDALLSEKALAYELVAWWPNSFSCIFPDLYSAAFHDFHIVFLFSFVSSEWKIILINRGMHPKTDRTIHSARRQTKYWSKGQIGEVTRRNWPRLNELSRGTTSTARSAGVKDGHNKLAFLRLLSASHERRWERAKVSLPDYHDLVMPFRVWNSGLGVIRNSMLKRSFISRNSRRK